MEDSEKLHHTYYLQFSTPSAKTIVLNVIGKEKLLNSKDEHLNDIPLHIWDNIAGFQFKGSEMVRKPTVILSFIYGKKLKEAKEGFSSSTAVCILKAVAREIIKENNNN